VRGWAAPGRLALAENWEGGTRVLSIIDLANTAILPTPTIGPSATAGPTQALPTLQPDGPALAVWQLPRPRSGEAPPASWFELDFKPAEWAQIDEPSIGSALYHRSLAHCSLLETGGHGLSPGLTKEQGQRDLGGLSYDTLSIGTAADGVLYIIYYGRLDEAEIMLQVNFYAQNADCLAAAERVLATLRHVR